MVRVIFESHHGERTTIEAASGTTVRDAAMAAGIDGIIGECGGNAMCATCHVYVNDARLDRLPERDENEDEMLELTAEPRRDSSRLSCQIALTDELDGLEIELPESQV